MSITLIFGLCAALIRIATGYLYVRDVYAGRNHPQRSAWTIFFTLNVIFIVAQLAEGARDSIIGLSVGTLIMLLVAPKLKSQGVGGFDLRDKVSLVVAVLGLLLWWATDEPLIALGSSLIVDSAGAWLVIEKTWRLPWSETWPAWMATVATGTLSLLAVGSLDYELMIVPGYMLSVGLIMNYVIWSRRKVIQRPANWE